MNRPRGRPRRDQAMPQRENMLAAALQLLESAGTEGFTMRALAERLGVNPMTVHHHFGGRDALIKALADHVYAGVSAPESGGGLVRIEALLRAYHACVVRHPELTLLVFSGPEVFPQQAQRITDDIASFLMDAGLSQHRSTLWVNILVDFTHGAAIATAMTTRKKAEGYTSDTEDFYAEALSELLRTIYAPQ